MSGAGENSGYHNLRTDEENKYKLELYKAALSNDWRKAESIYKKSRMRYGTVITPRGETALHIAASAGHTNFVKNLVREMSDVEIEMEMEKGDTAFHCAAMSGNVETAKAIATRNGDLVKRKNSGNGLAIQMAVYKGNKEMVRYLAADSAYLEEIAVPRSFLQDLIYSELYDVALKVAKSLVSQSKRINEEAALKSLARVPLTPHRSVSVLTSVFSSEKFVFNCAIELVELLWNRVASDGRRLSNLVNADCRLNGTNPIIEAAKHGNLEFLSVLIASYPDVLYAHDGDGHTIFHHAIMNRHISIFNLIHIGSVKSKVTSLEDDNGNAMLRMAATLPPPILLNKIPGAALQLQRELLLFEEVKKVMHPFEVNQKNDSDDEFDRMHDLLKNILSFLEDDGVGDNRQPAYFQSLTNLILMHMETRERKLNKLNETKFWRMEVLFEQMTEIIEQHRLTGTLNFADDSEGIKRITELQLWMKEFKRVLQEYERKQQNKFIEFTAHDLFVKEHENLMERGEKWMRNTANSCTIVTALITTIAFAAAITIPGGNGDDGSPHFSHEVLFKAFTIADSISMISSTTSLLNFLSVLTARYTIDDFRWSLPNKLVIGLSALFISIVAMMVAFVLSVFIIFKNSPMWLAISIAVVSSVPIILFIRQQSTLYLDVFRATYASYSLFKSKKNPYLHIQENERRRKSCPSTESCPEVIINICHKLM